MRKIEKKGELTSNTLITLILLIAGFVIVIFLYYQFSGTNRIDKEACHQSVLVRGALPSTVGLKEVVPLKCYTEKICITSGLFGGKCDDFAKEKGVSYVKVKTIDDVERTIAQSLVDCWSMMGQGDVLINTQWLSNYGFGDIISTCTVCSRIAFDYKGLEKVQITQSDIANVDVIMWMKRHIVPGKESLTYFDYLTKSGSAGVSTKRADGWTIPILDIQNGKVIQNGSILQGGTSGAVVANPKPSQLGIVFMQVTGPKTTDSIIGTVARSLGYGTGAFILSNLLFGPTNVALNSATAAVLAIFGIVDHQVNVYFQKAVTSGYCGDIGVGSQAQEGCSVVRMVDYNVKDLSKYCGKIESIDS